MSKNATFLFLIDSFENFQVLCQPEKIEAEYESVRASLPLLSPPKESVERLLKMLENKI